MLPTADHLQSNLARLRGQLRECCVPSDGSLDAAQGFAGRMPLSHSTSDQGLMAVAHSQELRSRTAQSLPARHVDQDLGRPDDICFYVGSMAFPLMRVGFLFSSTLTEHCPSGAVGLPFDSGGCVRRYKLPVGIPPIDFVKAHEMPVPLCRSYLGDLLQTHFASREDYLSGQPYRCPECGVLIDDPHGFREVQPDQLVRQHEIRIPGRLPVTHPHLMAVFVPRTLTDPGPKNRLPYKMHGAANLYNGFTSPPKSDSWGITWNAYKAVQALKNTGSYLETLVN